jgi:hypothetical protein
MATVNVSQYKNLFRLWRDQPVSDVFAHFHPEKDALTASLDFDAPFKKIGAKTFEGPLAWDFTQARFQNNYHDKPPKLRNYLRYTFIRLRDLEIADPGKYFLSTDDGKWICFNTGLQDRHSADLYSIFQQYESRPGQPQPKSASDWVYRGTVTSREPAYRNHFGIKLPGLAWYSNDSRDYIFNTEYTIDTDVFDHMFERAKDRSGFPDEATDESVRNYLRGAIENLLPKIRRNYKMAIPVYFVEERRMQMLLPFHSSNGRDISCFLVERDDPNHLYKIKTILDMDQAYFAARLITRPDKEWLNP